MDVSYDEAGASQLSELNEVEWLPSVFQWLLGLAQRGGEIGPTTAATGRRHKGSVTLCSALGADRNGSTAIGVLGERSKSSTNSTSKVTFKGSEYCGIQKARTTLASMVVEVAVR